MSSLPDQSSVRQGFARRLEECIRERGYSPHQQTAMGRIFGVSGQAVRKWLHGQSLPTAARVVHLARQLGVNASWLLHGEGTKYAEADNEEDAREVLRVSEREREVLYAYQRLNHRKRNAVWQVLQVLAEPD